MIEFRGVKGTPFDFTSQCLFGIPTDIPEPREDEMGHAHAVARVVTDLAYASDGGMFVLFTSHAALRRAADALRGERPSSRRATSCCADSATRATPSSSAPTRSGRAWTCPAGRSAPSC